MTVTLLRVLRRVAGLLTLAVLFVVWFAPRDASGTHGTVYISTDILKAIPDDDPDGVSSTLVINDPGKVADFDLGLGISHTSVGQLEVELKHITPSDERSAVLFGPTGCILNEINVILDDEATEFVVNACSSPPPAVGGRLRPSNALAVFDGMDIAGTWILTVRDLAAADVGTLQGWSLDIGQAAIAFEKSLAIPSGDSPCDSLDVEPLDELTISLGDEVLWCFLIENIGDVDLDLLTVDDDRLGTVPVPDAEIALVPGERRAVTVRDAPIASFTNTASVTARHDSNPFVVSASDTATVFVNHPPAFPGATGSLNGDGLLDAVFANSSPNSVCLGSGTGSFFCGDVSSDTNQTHAVALGDVNGDGLLDAVFANVERNRVCLGTGTGSFVCGDVGTNTDRTEGVALGDVDGDGFLDAVFANQAGPNTVCLGNGSGGFACTDLSDSFNSFGVALGYVDGDGFLDAVFANRELRNRVCLGTGTASFFCSDVNPDSNGTTGVALGDVDGDGKLDAVFANTVFELGSQRNRVCLGDGLGGFACGDVSSDINSTEGVALGDVDGDGNRDAVFANFGERNRLCLGDGLGGFDCSDVNSDTIETLGVALGDVDGDGNRDAVFANFGERKNRVCLGTGTGSFFCADVSSDTNNSFDVALAHSSSDMVGLVEPNGRWHFRRADGSDYTFFYGVPGDVPLFGDWDGDGFDTPGMYRASNGFAYLTNTFPQDGGVGVGDPALTFFFGIPGDQVFVGDWDGDGIDTLGISRNGKMFLANTNATVVADREFWFGVPTDMAFGGDADGDGTDGVFLYRPSSGFTYFTNSTPVGPNDVAPTHGTLFFGVPTDRFVIGDWNQDAIDTVGVFRPNTTTVFLRNTNTTGPADITYPYGQNTWTPIAGHWH